MPNINEELEKYINETIEKVKTNSLSFSEIMEYYDKLREHPKETVKYFGAKAIDLLGIDFFLNAITSMRESGEDVEEYVKDITLDMEQVHKLLKNVPEGISVDIKGKSATDILLDDLLPLKDVPGGISVDIECRSAADISLVDLFTLKALKVKINTIGFKDKNVEKTKINTYDVIQYARCRNYLDILVDHCLKFPPKDEENREKKIWGQVMRQLARYTTYHKQQIEDEDRLSEEEKEKIVEIDRNMIGGLIYRQCVCLGFAEIMRNAMLCCGIEARVVRGWPQDKKMGHAWNQVKLDGEWFNMDLTWNRDAIAARMPIGFLLASDQDFDDGFVFEGSPYAAHKEYSKSDDYKEKCERTVPVDEVWAYLDPSYEAMLKQVPAGRGTITHREWLKQCARQTRMGQIKDAAKTLIGDLKRGKERRKNHDKEQSDR